MRDQLFRRELVIGLARRRLSGMIGGAGEDPVGLMRISHLVEPFLHTWALGAMVDGAREKWTSGPDPAALAVLARGAEILGYAVGWPNTIDRRWPMPDPDWMRMQVPDGDVIVIPRGPRDGSPGLAVALDLPMGRIERMSVPAYLEIPGDMLAEQREQILASIASGATAGVRWTGPTPHDADGKAAVDAIRRAARSQSSFERYGLAGLAAGPGPTFEDLLTAPPRGRPGDPLTRCCDLAMLPRVGDNGQVDVVGVLLWDGPYAPLFVIPTAVELLRRLDGQTPTAMVAAAVGADEDGVRGILDQLVEAGAATAAS